MHVDVKVVVKYEVHGEVFDTIGEANEFANRERVRLIVRSQLQTFHDSLDDSTVLVGLSEYSRFDEFSCTLEGFLTDLHLRDKTYEN